MLTPGEQDLLFDILRGYICQHRHESRLSYTVGEQSLEQFEWHQGHADLVDGIQNKLIQILSSDK